MEKQNDVLGMLDRCVKALYKYQTVMNEYSSISKEYGPGLFMTETEAHTLGFIAGEEGMTSKRLGEITNRSKSTTSQIVKVLTAKGLIRRQVNPDNKREQLLFLTEKGKVANSQHQAYDHTTMYSVLEKLREHCTEDELTAFFKVLELRTAMYEPMITLEKRKVKSEK